MVADKKMADMEWDMVADMEVEKVADMLKYLDLYPTVARPPSNCWT